MDVHNVVNVYYKSTINLGGGRALLNVFHSVSILVATRYAPHTPFLATVMCCTEKLINCRFVICINNTCVHSYTLTISMVYLNSTCTWVTNVLPFSPIIIAGEMHPFHTQVQSDQRL